MRKWWFISDAMLKCYLSEIKQENHANLQYTVI